MTHATTANTTAVTNTSINPVLLGNLLAMMLAALASPMIYRDSEPVTAWLVVWTAPLVIASMFYVLAKVLMPSRIAAAGQKTFFKFAWVFLALFLLVHWQEFGGTASKVQSAHPTVVEHAPAKVAPANRQMSIDEFLADAPGQR